jgi:hypothetical protein
MAFVRKALWAVFVGLAGLFSGLMVERGLRTVYDPNKASDPESTDGDKTTEEPTETNCEASISNSEVEKADEEKPNEE